MTDEALDLLARQVLLDALHSEWEHGNETTVSFMPSKKYQQQMRDMLADPQGWCKRKLRPAWKKALRRVAAFFLTALVGVSAWLAIDTQAREAFFGWIKEVYEDSVIYRTIPSPAAKALPQYELAWLPDGFGEPDVYESETVHSALYQNSSTNKCVVFDYYLLSNEVQAKLFADQQPEQLLVNGVVADFYAASSDSESNNLLWVDAETGTFCAIDSNLSKDVILRIAESIYLVKAANK